MLDERKERVRQQYDGIASRYDAMDCVPAWLAGLPPLRKRHLARASGRVLEIAVGTGASLADYPEDCAIVGTDLSEGMLAEARRRADALGRDARFVVMDVEALDFEDGAFDTVVSCMSLCTFGDPIRALREMARVCRPHGRVLLFEHGRSSTGWLARWQDRRAHAHAEPLGCDWSREPLELAMAAGLRITKAERRRLGVVHLIEAAGGLAS
jgi:ubiquinone/menaquinone biosynthesis C-methylase UbiE